VCPIVAKYQPQLFRSVPRRPQAGRNGAGAPPAGDVRRDAAHDVTADFGHSTLLGFAGPWARRSQSTQVIGGAMHRGGSLFPPVPRLPSRIGRPVTRHRTSLQHPAHLLRIPGVLLLINHLITNIAAASDSGRLSALGGEA